MNRLECIDCKTVYAFDDPRYKCDCGGLLDLRFEARIAPERLPGRRPTLWRYREALPIAGDEHIVSFDEGFTPLTKITLAGRPLFLKQEHLFPTGSYKDRGATLLISRAVELGVTRIVEDSSGNAGCAIAAYAAKAGISCDIYVPESTSPAKLAQIRFYGATLHRIPGSREDTARAVLQAAESCFYASHSWNPFFFQGTKTFAYETWEQLGFKAPDILLLPAGNGTLLLGAGLGFEDLLRQGLIDRLPRIFAVQAHNCAPLYGAWRARGQAPPPPKTAPTLAEGIAIAEPVRARQIVDLVERTGGEILTVTEDEIKTALLDLGRQGWYTEPTSAAAIAAFRKSAFPENQTVVAPLTGHGLKSTEKILDLLDAAQE